MESVKVMVRIMNQKCISDRDIKKFIWRCPERRWKRYEFEVLKIPCWTHLKFKMFVGEAKT